MKPKWARGRVALDVRTVRDVRRLEKMAEGYAEGPKKGKDALIRAYKVVEVRGRSLRSPCWYSKNVTYPLGITRTARLNRDPHLECESGLHLLARSISRRWRNDKGYRGSRYAVLRVLFRLSGGVTVPDLSARPLYRASWNRLEAKFRVGKLYVASIERRCR